MLSAEGTGKTIEKAIESALLELKASREDVDIKILNEGGLFKKAKVVVTISEDAKEKYIKREKVRREEKVTTIEAKVQEDKPIEIESPEKKEKTVVENKETVKETVSEKPKAKREEKVVDAITFLEGLFKTLGKEVEISALEDDRFITYSVTGENLGETIGRRGETFYAISNLLTAVTGRGEKKILLDIAGYREKREESLTITAKRIANKVAKSGRYMKLEPMNPSERRIIHTALQDDERVTTLSKGTEPRRYVIIFPKEYNDKH